MARAKPGELNWAGVTGALDFMFEGWLKIAGLDMKKVPYRNPVEAANDLADRPRAGLRVGGTPSPSRRSRPARSSCWRVINTARAPAYPGHSDRRRRPAIRR